MTVTRRKLRRLNRKTRKRRRTRRCTPPRSRPRISRKGRSRRRRLSRQRGGSEASKSEEMKGSYCPLSGDNMEQGFEFYPYCCEHPVRGQLDIFEGIYDSIDETTGNCSLCRKPLRPGVEDALLRYHSTKGDDESWEVLSNWLGPEAKQWPRPKKKREKGTPFSIRNLSNPMKPVNTVIRKK